MGTGISPNVVLSFRCNHIWLTYWTSITYDLYLLVHVSALWYLVSQIIKIKKNWHTRRLRHQKVNRTKEINVRTEED